MATAAKPQNHVIEYEDYIDQQLARTSLHVKTLDLVTGLTVLGLVVLGSLFAIVVVDHWIVGLGFGARLCALIAVVSASLFVLARHVLPPLIRAINPEYSAQVVERSFPTLDNGLTSFLFFRRQRDLVRESIFTGIQRQAAEGLAEVPVDSAVDRSSIVKLGYAMVAVTAVWCAYILLSPKDPLQTVMRIAAPWQDIARPSQVDILAVSPGNVELFRGQTVTIKAEIQGLKQNAMPAIEFSTLDGQLLNQRLSMSTNGVDGRFAGVLTTGETGIEQDLEYRVVAGDAVSRTYEVHTSEAPHIVVERVSYDFPDYTGLQDEVVEGEGDIRAIEGTRVTVFGKANQPVRRGHIELLAALEDPNDIATAGPSKQAPLLVSGQDAQVRFSLRMGPDQQRSIYRAYRLHFVNEKGVASVDPIEHTIEVNRDLRPIVEIMTPTKRTLEVPENGWEKIVVRAVDPDFQLTRVTLSARTRGRPLFRQEMLAEPQQGQFTSTFQFTPLEFGLKQGDVVEYSAAAEDNRHSPLQAKLDPNRTVSSKQYFRIVEADPLVQESPRPDDFERPEPNRDQPNDSTPGDQKQPDRDQNDQSGDQENREGEARDQPQPSGGEQRPEENRDEESEPGQEGGESGLQQSGKNDGDAKQQELDSGQSGDAQPDSPDSQRSGGDSQETDAGEQDSGAESNRDGEPGGSAERRGDRPDADDPLPSTGERDGEVIDRIRKHLEEKGKLDPPTDDQSQPGQDAESEQPEASQDADGSSTDADQDATSESTDSADPDRTPPSEKPEAGDGTVSDSEPRDGPQDATQKSQDDQPPSTSPGGQTDQDGAKKDASGPGQAKDGQPSEKPGTPGDQGDRHTDAANQADKPGPSPPDGQKPPEERDGKPSPQQSESPTDPSSKDSRNGESGTKGQPEQSKGEQESGEKGADQGSKRQGSGEATPGKEGKPGDEQVGKQEDDGAKTEDGSSEQADSQSESGDAKSDAGEATGDADPSKATDNKSTSKPSSKSSSSPSAEGKGKPGTQNDGADTTETGDGAAAGEPAGDEANLEFKKKVTDLALEYLRDQQRKPDPDLLDKLGWDQDDVDSFLRRWDELKRKAEGEGTAADEAKRQLDDVLRNMQLDSRSGVRRAGTNNDRQRNNRNTGRRTKVPADLLDPFRAFQRSLQRSR